MDPRHPLDLPRRTRAALGLCLLGSVAGCYPPSQAVDDFGSYTGDAVNGTRDAGTDDDDDDDEGTPEPGDGASDGSDGSDGSPGNGDGTPGDGSPGNGDGTPGDGDPAPVDGDPGTGDGDPGAQLTSLSFSVRTQEVGGRYAPRNIGAIWVEDSSGGFVKTLAEWARTRERYLTNFLDVTGGDTTDAITSATLSQHTTHDVSWDLTDVSGVAVPDGNYQIVMELTDQNGTGRTSSVPFTKGTESVQLTPADTANFVDMQLSMQ